jgi:IS1 family transposase
VNVLSQEERVRVLSALVEGNSLSATERMTGTWRKPITRLLVQVGAGCGRLHDGLMRRLHCSVLELDEIWSFVKKKEARVQPEDPEEYGDAYTFVAMDVASKLIPSYRVAKRTPPHFNAFALDLRARVVGAPQLTTDGHKAYLEAIEEAFGAEVHYAQILKTYRADESGGASRDDVRYSQGRVVRSVKRIISGTPDEGAISTSGIERQNLTMRMSQRRFTRLTNAFSKCAANLQAAVALYVAHYNLCRVHLTLRVTPAMEAGITDHVWSLGELLEGALTAPEPPPLELPTLPLAGRSVRPGAVRVLPGQLALPGVL